MPKEQDFPEDLLGAARAALVDNIDRMHAIFCQGGIRIDRLKWGERCPKCGAATDEECGRTA